MAGRCCATAVSSSSTPSGSWLTRPRPCGYWPMPGADRFRRLPKIELHLHAAGSVRPATMREFVAADGLAPALGERYTTAARGEGLPAYLTRFAAWDTTVNTPQRFARVVAELIEDLSADGVGGRVHRRDAARMERGASDPRGATRRGLGRPWHRGARHRGRRIDRR